MEMNRSIKRHMVRNINLLKLAPKYRQPQPRKDKTNRNFIPLIKNQRWSRELIIDKDHVPLQTIRRPTLPREIQRELHLRSLDEGNELHERD